MHMGKVVLVGAGPGDPKLITVKGKSYIEQADCIIYDRLISRRLLCLAKADCELIYAGKENHHHVMRQEQMNELLFEKTKQYSLVVRLKGGDPYVFGRGGEEALYLSERGVTVEVVPGISSSVAVPAYAGIPITHRGLSKGFHVITSHCKKDEIADIDYAMLADEKETCVFLMGLRHVEEIAKGLMAAGRSPKTPAAVISNGTKNGQKECVGILEDIAARVREAQLISPAIIVVGEVVKLSSRLAFFENRPLFGRKYLIPYICGGRFSFSGGWRTEAHSELAQRLEELGAEVYTFQTGSIQPVMCDMNDMNDLSEKDYLVFTSKNAVYAFLWNLKNSKKDLRALGNCKVAVVGRKTAQVLQDFGITADVIPARQTGEGLGEVLADIVSEDARVIWFCAKETGSGIYDMLQGKCNLITRICYENVEKSIRFLPGEFEAYASCDGVFFTSGSNVKRTIKAMEHTLPKEVYSIGEVCSRCLTDLGIETYVEAETPSYDGLIDLVWRQN
ncbi:MAG: uroporphyrinogen-III C-methyltransferase [bacterium]|nr:uroporphyrinogen-III C-methyltransferase [bacterium]